MIGIVILREGKRDYITIGRRKLSTCLLSALLLALLLLRDLVSSRTGIVTVSVVVSPH